MSGREVGMRWAEAGGGV